MGHLSIAPKAIQSTICPICNTVIKNVYDKELTDHRKYCSCCGLPLKVSSPSSTENVKFCFRCDAVNPAEARYCRCCGKDIQLDGKVYGKECNHSWVDLGLSVLWSTETLHEGLFFQWMNSKQWLYADRQIFSEKDYLNGANPFTDFKGDGKDVASAYWGGKWRTPTKEEFEELISKCEWEKIIIAGTDDHALKITGPNGYYIILRTTGTAGCATDKNSERAESLHCDCFLWTSTEAECHESGRKRAYCFGCRGYEPFAPTLLKDNRSVHYVPNSLFTLTANGRIISRRERTTPSSSNSSDDEELRREMEANKERDMKKRHELWLNSPLDFKVLPNPQSRGLAIRPVMDKE